MILEDQVPIPLAVPKNNPIFGNIITMNKKYFGLPATPDITPEYTKKVNDELAKRNVSSPNRTFLGSAAGLLPFYGDAYDFNTMMEGIFDKDIEKMNGGAIGLLNPYFSLKAIQAFGDYVMEKWAGKGATDSAANKRNEIVNMTPHETQELFKRYGMGGYDKWVKDGRPSLYK